MLKTILAGFYERDIRKLIEEINLFKNEELKSKMGDNAKLQAAEFKRDEIAKSFWEIIEKAANK